MTADFWTAFSAIATAVAAIMAACAAGAVILLLRETHRQVVESQQQVLISQQQVEVMQHQVAVMQQQIIAEYMPILEVVHPVGTRLQQIFNSGNGPARNIAIVIPDKDFAVNLAEVIAPQRTYDRHLLDILRNLPGFSDNEQMVIRYSDILGNEYEDVYIRQPGVDPPQWIPDNEEM
jgi:hypothetical protein